jgi:hypothetical protein
MDSSAVTHRLVSTIFCGILLLILIYFRELALSFVFISTCTTYFSKIDLWILPHSAYIYRYVSRMIYRINDKLYVMCGMCMYGFCYVWAFGNMCTCVYCVFVLFRLGIFILFMLLFNSVSYVFSLSCLCILIVMYALFHTFCFHRASWHSSSTITEDSPCFFLICKANTRV